jgi:hypothetical protein
VSRPLGLLQLSLPLSVAGVSPPPVKAVKAGLRHQKCHSPQKWHQQSTKVAPTIPVSGINFDFVYN